MVREVPAPRNLPSRIPFASLDHAMVHMAGLPFKVPRTVYPWVHDFFVVPKPRQPHKWRGITNAKPYNLHGGKIKFKLGGVNQTRATVRAHDWLAGYDIKHFFPHVNLLEYFRPHFYIRYKRRGDNFTRCFKIDF